MVMTSYFRPGNTAVMFSPSDREGPAGGDTRALSERKEMAKYKSDK